MILKVAVASSTATRSPPTETDALEEIVYVDKATAAPTALARSSAPHLSVPAITTRRARAPVYLDGKVATATVLKLARTR